MRHKVFPRCPPCVCRSAQSGKILSSGGFAKGKRTMAQEASSMHQQQGISRRTFMKATASGLAAGAATAGFPNASWSAGGLRTIGLGVSIINEIQAQDAKEPGLSGE